jgi:hypothetical protein
VVSTSDVLRRSILAFRWGELLGFVPAVVGATLGLAGAPDASMVAALTAAGALEGAVLGVVQGRVSAARWRGRRGGCR